jgi:pheromone shutdown protein TraB
MDEKVYDLLEKLYVEVQGMQTEIRDIRETMATKDDLKNLATKDDIDMLAEELHTEIQTVYDELVELRNDFNAMQVLTTKNAYDIARFKIAR